MVTKNSSFSPKGLLVCQTWVVKTLTFLFEVTSHLPDLVGGLLHEECLYLLMHSKMNEFESNWKL